MVRLPFRSSMHFRHARVSPGISRAIDAADASMGRPR
jgi:hypothetical protein